MSDWKTMLDYKQLRRKYKPEDVKTLLIGEAPPPNGTTFFYVPKLPSSRRIEDERTMSATVFNHYFGELPKSLQAYEEFLLVLKNHGIYLIDILDEPLRIRGHSTNEAYLVAQMPYLREKVQNEGIFLPEENWTFLLARTTYKKHINTLYPKAKAIRWVDFRLSHELLNS